MICVNHGTLLRSALLQGQGSTPYKQQLICRLRNNFSKASFFPLGSERNISFPVYTHNISICINSFDTALNFQFYFCVIMNNQSLICPVQILISSFFGLLLLPFSFRFRYSPQHSHSVARLSLVI